MERRRVPKIVTCHHGDLEWTLKLVKFFLFSPNSYPRRALELSWFYPLDTRERQAVSIRGR